MATGKLFHAALELGTIDELAPLAGLLEVDLPAKQMAFAGDELKERIWKELGYYGSHGLAYLLRGFEGVDYPEIVRDVCEKKGITATPGNTLRAVEKNEARLLETLFAEIWDRMSDEEKRALLRAMNLDEGQFRLGGAAAVGFVLAGEMAGFAAYRLAAIVAGYIARALLASSVRFAAMHTVMRGLGVVLGPVGWIASGAWLAHDLAGPAYRKTVPAVLQVGYLRQLARQRDVIGVIGSGSVGKDSLIKYVFGIDTGRISPIPGSTSAAEVYQLPEPSRVRIHNLPGFGDLRESVRKEIEDQLRNCNLAVYIIDASRIVRREEIDRFSRATTLAQSRIVVFNYCDKLDSDEFDQIITENKKRLGVANPVLTCLKPKTRGKNPYFESGVRELRQRINEWSIGTRHKSPIFTDEGADSPMRIRL